MQVDIDYELRESRETFIASVQMNELQDAMEFIDSFIEWAECHHYKIKKVVMT